MHAVLVHVRIGCGGGRWCVVRYTVPRWLGCRHIYVMLDSIEAAMINVCCVKNFVVVPVC